MPDREKSRSSSRRVAFVGVFVALAMIFSYVEALVPVNFGIPGVKLGVANLVIVLCLSRLSAGEVWLISMLRILLIGWLFGNGMSLIYSLAGGALSLLVMMIVKKTGLLGTLGISMLGGIFHNLGQLGAARVVLGSSAIWGYFPVLFLSGLITGALIGLLAGRIDRLLHPFSDIFSA